MNRNGRRLLKNKHGLTPKMLDDLYDKVRAETRRDAYNNAFAGMLLALNQLHGFGYKRIRAVAVKTLQNINGTTCATELIEAVKAATGFDVEEPILDDELGMEVE